MARCRCPGVSRLTTDANRVLVQRLAAMRSCSFREGDFMASRGYAAVSAGALIAESLERVRQSRDASLVYLLLLVAGNAMSDYLAATGAVRAEVAAVAGLLKLGIAILTIVGTYLLIENMARKSGQLRPDIDRR